MWPVLIQSLLSFLFYNSSSLYTKRNVFFHARKVSSWEEKIQKIFFILCVLRQILFPVLIEFSYAFRNFPTKIGWTIFLFKWGQVLLAPVTRTILCEGGLPAGFTFKASVWLHLFSFLKSLQWSHLAGQGHASCTSIIVSAFQMVDLETKKEIHSLSLMQNNEWRNCRMLGEKYTITRGQFCNLLWGLNNFNLKSRVKKKNNQNN